MKNFVLRKKKEINPEDYKSYGMEIIDKKHDAITVNKTVNQSSFIKFHTDKEIFFTGMAAKKYGLKSGLYVHFVNDDDQWLFYVDDNPDGFELSPKAVGNRYEKSRIKTMAIYNQALIRLFLKRTRCSLPCKFPLKVTESRYNGKQLLKIEINKPIG